MPQQLTWWSTHQPPAATGPTWEELDPAEQSRLIAALTKLIVQSVENPQQCKEDNHEQ